MGFSLKHDNQTPILKREYDKYSEVLVSKNSLFIPRPNYRPPVPLFSITSRGSMCALDKRMGGGGSLCRASKGGWKPSTSLCSERITHYVQRITSHYALRASGEQSRRRSGNRPGGVGASCKLPGNRSMGWGVPRGVPRGQWVAPTNLTPNSHQTLMIGGSFHKG